MKTVKLLNFWETKKLLEKYRIPFCQSCLVQTKKEALKEADRIGYPLVLKISSPKILHRSEIGGVKVGIRNKEELERAFEEMEKIPGEKEGIILQKMLSGIEVAMGVKRDPQFGPVLLFGLGGIFIELLEDISLRICPVSQKEARKMILEIKGARIFFGFRNLPKVEIKTLAQTLVSLSQLAVGEREIREIDLNPVICRGEEIKVVDAKFLR